MLDFEAMLPPAQGRLNNDVVMRLQVDDHEWPIGELRRLVTIAAKQRQWFGPVELR